jgi:hypothetical protein
MKASGQSLTYPPRHTGPEGHAWVGVQHRGLGFVGRGNLKPFVTLLGVKCQSLDSHKVFSQTLIYQELPLTCRNAGMHAMAGHDCPYGHVRYTRSLPQ